MRSYTLLSQLHALNHWRVYYGVRRSSSVRPGVSSSRGRVFAGCLGGFSSARRPVLDASLSDPIRYTPDCLSRARLSRDASRLSLLLNLLQRFVGSTTGAVILYFLSSPDVGGLPSTSPVSLSSISHRPSLNKNPAFLWQWRVPSGLPASWSPLRTAKLFVGVDWFIGNDRFTSSPLTRSSDNSLSSSRYSKPSAYLSPIGQSSTSDPDFLRWSPHLLPILCTLVWLQVQHSRCVASSLGVLSNSKSGFSVTDKVLTSIFLYALATVMT